MRSAFGDDIVEAPEQVSAFGDPLGSPTIDQPESTFSSFGDPIMEDPGFTSLNVYHPLDKKNWLDAFRDVGDKPYSYLPYINLMDISDSWTLMKAARAKEGGTITPEQDELLSTFLQNQQRDSTWGYKVWNTVLRMPSYAIEFLTAGGLVKGGAKAILLKSGEAGLKEMIKRGIKTGGEVGAEKLAMDLLLKKMPKVAETLAVGKTGRTLAGFFAEDTASAFGLAAEKFAAQAAKKAPGTLDEVLGKEVIEQMATTHGPLSPEMVLDMTTDAEIKASTFKVLLDQYKGETVSAAGKYTAQKLAMAFGPQQIFNTQHIIKTMIDNAAPTFGLTEDEKNNLHMMIVDKGDDWFTAFLKSYGNWGIENFSEYTGENFNLLKGLFGKQITSAATKLAFFDGIVTRGAVRLGASPETIQAAKSSIAKYMVGTTGEPGLIRKMGWNGVIPELGEEVVAGALQQATGISPPGLPSLEDVSAMAVGFMINPMIISTGIAESRYKYIREKLNDVVDTFSELKMGKFHTYEALKPMEDKILDIVDYDKQQPEGIWDRVQRFFVGNAANRKIKEVFEDTVFASLDELEGTNDREQVRRWIASRFGIVPVENEEDKQAMIKLHDQKFVKPTTGIPSAWEDSYASGYALAQDKKMVTDLAKKYPFAIKQVSSPGSNHTFKLFSIDKDSDQMETPYDQLSEEDRMYWSRFRGFGPFSSDFHEQGRRFYEKMRGIYEGLKENGKRVSFVLRKFVAGTREEFTQSANELPDFSQPVEEGSDIYVMAVGGELSNNGMEAYLNPHTSDYSIAVEMTGMLMGGIEYFPQSFMAMGQSLLEHTKSKRIRDILTRGGNELDRKGVLEVFQKAFVMSRLGFDAIEFDKDIANEIDRGNIQMDETMDVFMNSIPGAVKILTAVKSIAGALYNPTAADHLSESLQAKAKARLNAATQADQWQESLGVPEFVPQDLPFEPPLGPVITSGTLNNLLNQIESEEAEPQEGEKSQSLMTKRDLFNEFYKHLVDQKKIAQGINEEVLREFISKMVKTSGGDKDVRKALSEMVHDLALEQPPLYISLGLRRIEKEKAKEPSKTPKLPLEEKRPLIPAKEEISKPAPQAVIPAAKEKETPKEEVKKVVPKTETPPTAQVTAQVPVAKKEMQSIAAVINKISDLKKQKEFKDLVTAMQDLQSNRGAVRVVGGMDRSELRKKVEGELPDIVDLNAGPTNFEDFIPDDLRDESFSNEAQMAKALESHSLQGQVLKVLGHNSFSTITHLAQTNQETIEAIRTEKTWNEWLEKKVDSIGMMEVKKALKQFNYDEMYYIMDFFKDAQNVGAFMAWYKSDYEFDHPIFKMYPMNVSHQAAYWAEHIADHLQQILRTPALRESVNQYFDLVDKFAKDSLKDKSVRPQFNIVSAMFLNYITDIPLSMWQSAAEKNPKYIYGLNKEGKETGIWRSLQFQFSLNRTLPVDQFIEQMMNDTFVGFHPGTKLQENPGQNKQLESSLVQLMELANTEYTRSMRYITPLGNSRISMVMSSQLTKVLKRNVFYLVGATSSESRFDGTRDSKSLENDRMIFDDVFEIARQLFSESYPQQNYNPETGEMTVTDKYLQLLRRFGDKDKIVFSYMTKYTGEQATEIFRKYYDEQRALSKENADLYYYTPAEFKKLDPFMKNFVVNTMILDRELGGHYENYSKPIEFSKRMAQVPSDVLHFREDIKDGAAESFNMLIVKDGKLSALQKLFDGQTIILDHLWDRWQKSMGRIASKKDLFPKLRSFKNLINFLNADKVRFMVKSHHAGFVTGDELQGNERSKNAYLVLKDFVEEYNKTHEDQIDAIGFDSGVKVKDSSYVMDIMTATEDGKFSISKSKQIKLMTIPTSGSGRQLDFRKNPVPARREIPRQVESVFQALYKVSPNITEILNRIADDQLAKFVSEGFDLSSMEKDPYYSRIYPYLKVDGGNGAQLDPDNPLIASQVQSFKASKLKSRLRPKILASMLTEVSSGRLDSDTVAHFTMMVNENGIWREAKEHELGSKIRLATINTSIPERAEDVDIAEFSTYDEAKKYMNDQEKHFQKVSLIREDRTDPLAPRFIVKHRMHGVRQATGPFSTLEEVVQHIRNNPWTFSDMIENVDVLPILAKEKTVEGRNELRGSLVVQTHEIKQLDNGKFAIPGGFILYVRTPSGNVNNVRLARNWNYIPDGNFVAPHEKTMEISGADKDGDQAFAGVMWSDPEGKLYMPSQSIDASIEANINSIFFLLRSAYQDISNWEIINNAVNSHQYDDIVEHWRTLQESEQTYPATSPEFFKQVYDSEQLGNSCKGIFAKGIQAYSHLLEAGWLLPKEDTGTESLNAIDTLGFIKIRREQNLRRYDPNREIVGMIDNLLQQALDNYTDPMLGDEGFTPEFAKMFLFALTHNDFGSQPVTKEMLHDFFFRFTELMHSDMGQYMKSMENKKGSYRGRGVSEKGSTFRFGMPHIFNKMEQRFPDQREQVNALRSLDKYASEWFQIGKALINSKMDVKATYIEYRNDRNTINAIQLNAHPYFDSSNIVKDGVFHPTFRRVATSMQIQNERIYNNTPFMTKAGRELATRYLTKNEFAKDDQFEQVLRKINSMLVLNSVWPVGVHAATTLQVIGDELAKIHNSLLSDARFSKNKFLKSMMYQIQNDGTGVLGIFDPYRLGLPSEKDIKEIQDDFDAIGTVGDTTSEISLYPGFKMTPLAWENIKRMYISYTLAHFGVTFSTRKGGFLPIIGPKFLNAMNSDIMNEMEDWQNDSFPDSKMDWMESQLDDIYEHYVPYEAYESARNQKAKDVSQSLMTMNDLHALTRGYDSAGGKALFEEYGRNKDEIDSLIYKGVIYWQKLMIMAGADPITGYTYETEPDRVTGKYHVVNASLLPELQGYIVTSTDSLAEAKREAEKLNLENPPKKISQSQREEAMRRLKVAMAIVEDTTRDKLNPSHPLFEETQYDENGKLIKKYVSITGVKRDDQGQKVRIHFGFDEDAEDMVFAVDAEDVSDFDDFYTPEGRQRLGQLVRAIRIAYQERGVFNQIMNRFSGTEYIRFLPRYILHRFKKKTAEDHAAEKNFNRYKTETGRSKARKFPSYMDAAMLYGLEPITQNPADLVRMWFEDVGTTVGNNIALNMAMLSRNIDGSPVILADFLGGMKQEEMDEDSDIKIAITPEVVKRATEQLLDYGNMIMKMRNPKYKRITLKSDLDPYLAYNEVRDAFSTLLFNRDTQKGLGFTPVLEEGSNFSKGMIKNWYANDRYGRNMMKMIDDGYKTWMIGNKDLLAGIQAFNQISKNVTLSLSLFHPAALIEAFLAAGGITKRGWENIRWWSIDRSVEVFEKKASWKNFIPWYESYVNVRNVYRRSIADPNFSMRWMRSGLRFDVTNPNIMSEGKRSHDWVSRSMDWMMGQDLPVISRGAKLWKGYNEWINQWLWRGLFPALKLYTAEQVFTELKSQYDLTGKEYRTDRLMGQISEYVNAMYGGLNFNKMIWATPKMRQLLHLLLFAPDWTLAAAKIAGLGNLPIISNFLGRQPSLVKELEMKEYWPAMIIMVMTAIPMAIQMAIYGAFGDPEEKDKLFIWQNEFGKAGIWDLSWGVGGHIDITPIMRKFPGYEGGKTGKRRVYIRWAKQSTEVLDGWLTNFSQQFMNKTSTSVRTVFEQMTGTNTAGWELDFVDQGVSGVLFGKEDGIFGGRIAEVVKKFAPMSVLSLIQGRPSSFFAPATTGISQTTAEKKMADILSVYADDKAWSKIQASDKLQHDLSILGPRILNAAAMNGLDPDGVLVAAKRAVLAKKYSEFFTLLNREDYSELDRVAKSILRVNGTVDGWFRSMKQRFKEAGKTMTEEQKLEGLKAFGMLTMPVKVSTAEIPEEPTEQKWLADQTPWD